MKAKRMFLQSIVLKSFGVLAGLTGLGLTFLGSDGFVSSSKALLYFTIQSNLWTLLLMTVYLIHTIRVYRGHESQLPHWFGKLKYVVTVSIALTFVVFAVLLSPFMSLSYLASATNLCMHFLAPIAAILDFIFFDHPKDLRKKDVFWTWIPPLYYLIFALSLSFAGVRFAAGAIVPYYFLDYSTRGWLRISEHGLGVIYWFILMLLLVSGLALGLRSLVARVERKRAKAVSLPAESN